MHLTSHPRHQLVVDRQARFEADAAQARLRRSTRRAVPTATPAPRPPARPPLRVVPPLAPAYTLKRNSITSPSATS